MDGITSDAGRLIPVSPRYYRWHVDPGVEWVEQNTGYATVDWQIPVQQAAVVLVDVWDRHYLKDTQARAETIIREKIAPLLDVCREAGLQLIHAPSPPQATPHDKWLNLLQGEGPAPVEHDPDWPPPEFRATSGPYAPYARPFEPRDEERNAHVSQRTIHPLAEPRGDDVVISTGEELHRFCKERGILFLFYLGFNTNACILLRDYGTIRMAQRGYCVVLLRDCGTGMESSETQADLSQTKGAVLFLEMFGKYSLTSEELIAGLRASI